LSDIEAFIAFVAHARIDGTALLPYFVRL
jgi:hypothetical protein